MCYFLTKNLYLFLTDPNLKIVNRNDLYSKVCIFTFYFLYVVLNYCNEISEAGYLTKRKGVFWFLLLEVYDLASSFDSLLDKRVPRWHGDPRDKIQTAQMNLCLSCPFLIL